MTTQRVYLDYAATTPVRPEVRRAMEPYLSERFGNPSSMHAVGREARAAIEEARDRVRDALGGRSGRVVFTGSGSEADNLAILGYARRRRETRVIRSAIEHSAVVASTAVLEREGYEVRVAPVDGRGVVRLDALRDLIPDGRPALVSVMWVNNETGVVQPVAEIGALCRERGAAFHTDAVQAIGKVELAVESVPVDLVAISAHKIGGPKGTGALWIRDGIELDPIVHGGGHEHGLRSGTQDVPAIVGLAEAAALAVGEQTAESRRLAGLRDRLARGLLETLPDLVVNGGDAPERAPHVLNVSVPGVDIEALVTGLDLEGICVSTGSACSTGSVRPSHVAVAMGREGELARNTVRMSLGPDTTADQIDRVLRVFARMVHRVRELASAS